MNLKYQLGARVIIMGVMLVIFYALVTPNPSIISYFIYGISAVLLFGALWFQAKRDVYVCAEISLFASFIVAIVSVATMYMAQKVGILSLVIFIISISGFIISIGFMARVHWGPEDLPNLLKEYTDWDNVYESEGIQFVTSQSASMLEAIDDVVVIEIIAQNTWDTEREICFKLKCHTHVSLNSAGLIYEKKPRIFLGPAMVGKLRVGVIAHPDAHGHYSLELHPVISGSTGKRIRRKRATFYSPETAGWQTLTQKIKFPIQVEQSNDPTRVPPNPLQTESEILWTLNDYSR